MGKQVKFMLTCVIMFLAINLSGTVPTHSPGSPGALEMSVIIVGSTVGFLTMCALICCCYCKRRRGGVIQTPRNAIVYTTATVPVGQGYSIGLSSPPPNTGYGPGMSQQFVAQGSGIQAPNA
ncbi:uncharacterized protein LOC106153533 [Lingula anatina]|uniref:Uncharacterized protein LOC106153533 n=1 Tax=Lingula anatina TaxID=7574 RepID=A0A1S3HAB1_LINAN|nr:uncharacterized protein LOC106153533 [Lingula anatina]|eukprot:XP_013382962.1 uncharacterized protein LOC106153533 [Lingula anatina]